MNTSPARHRINERLEDYWQELKGDRAMPLESEVSVEALKEIWDYCFLVNAYDGRFAYSYMGEQLIEAYGDDMTGREIATTLLEPHPESLFATFQYVKDQGKPKIDESEFTNSRGVLIKYRSCVLPLGARGHTSTAYLLGGMKWKAY